MRKKYVQKYKYFIILNCTRNSIFAKYDLFIAILKVIKFKKNDAMENTLIFL